MVSLIPVIAGVLVYLSGNFLFDSLFALLIAGVIVVATVQSVIGSHKELLWPDNVSCGHSAPEQG
jgi:cobalt-zinc-cadmium efflux system protein